MVKGSGMRLYEGKRKRGEFCDKHFQPGDMIAVVLASVEGETRPYEITFCLKGGSMICIGAWQIQNEYKDTGFEGREYRGRQRRDNYGDLPAYI